MNEHHVTAEHLRRLATVDKSSMFRDAGTLIDTEEGVTQVPFRVVEATLTAGRNSPTAVCCMTAASSSRTAWLPEPGQRRSMAATLT